MRSASSLSHIAATNNTTFSTCKIVNTVMVVSIQRTFVTLLAHYFALSDLVVSMFFIYLYIVLRRRTIYLCGVVQFHNANINFV